MVSFPNGKINIGLQITGRRPDGYHNLQTVFYPVRIYDVLEFVNAPEYVLSETGIPSGAQVTDNICSRAWQLLKKDHPGITPIHIHLHKAIPSGAGLGGGSSDASFCLRMLNEKFELSLTNDQLMKYALQLGSDCPFFIVNKPCYATGTGEHLEEIMLDISPYKILVINPLIVVSTAQVFSQIKSYSTDNSLRHAINDPVTSWKEKIFNDLEKPVFEAFPEIALIKKTLYSAGAIYASMTGSGSSIFAVFAPDANPIFNFPAHYFQKWV